MPSFSGDVKNELARLPLSKACCERAELAGLLRMGASLTLGSGRALGLSFVTEHAAVARRALVLLKQAGAGRTEVVVRRSRRLGKMNSYSIRVVPGEDVGALLAELELSPGMLSPSGKSALFRRKCCRVAYLRGAFLAGGSVSRPEASCHLEYVTTNYQFAELLQSLLRRFGFSAGLTGRKEDYVVYLKEGDAILDFLALAGAEEAATSFEAARNVKEVRNQVNRLVNCETANLQKAVDAAGRQLAEIQELQARGLLEELPKKLREAAEARLANPEASLAELADILGISKSGASHRMRKLKELAEAAIDSKVEE